MTAEERPVPEAAQPAADTDRELLIRELAAILAAWGVTEKDDELLAPIAETVAGLVAGGQTDGHPG